MQRYNRPMIRNVGPIVYSVYNRRRRGL